MDETGTNSSSPTVNKKTLWMGDLEPIMDEAAIASAFERMGEKAEMVKFVRDKRTKVRINSYCFVEFKDSESAERALKRLNGKPLPNFPHVNFKLNLGQYGKEPGRSVYRKNEFSLFIGNLTDEVDESQLLNFFSSRYSTVREAKLCRNPDGTTKNFGFVRFFNEQDSLEALNRMNGVRGLGSKPLYVSQATPKPYFPKEKYNRNEDYHHQDTYGYYYQQYQSSQYPQQQQQQQQYQSPYYGGDTWGGQSYQPYQQYQQPYDYGSQSQEAQSSVGTSQPSQQISAKDSEKDEDEEFEDQGLHLNVTKLNEEFIQNNEEFYASLEKSRWHFIESVTTNLDDICMT
ncbi:tRNA selenocysteine 1-associated protein 1 [Holothuria leucospilota]|uniref:tRNA selenocysteine-associated protein 1 n=1 Tax=Holothuria leucospilota TaxID=206669 RepID=A0A9Q1H575_HOLLE|nr:tRNA selenocysteine 1-associated protein 1 [Holothuria leucospilota]